METFDLGRVMQTAEAIKGMRQQSITERLRQQYMGAQEGRAVAQDQRAAAAEQRAATQFSQEQQIENTRLLNAAAAEIAQNPQAATRWLPVLKQNGVLAQDYDPSGMAPQELQEQARQIFESTKQALSAYGQAAGAGNVQSTQILANGNIGYLTRSGQLIDTGQKAKEQLQLTEVGGAPAVVNLREARTTALSSPEEERRAAAAQAAAVAGAQTSAQQQAQIAAIPERAAAEQAAERAGAQVQNERTFNAYSTAMASLKQALGGTRTGPASGRIPAVTAPQQTAEGAIAAMAPVLKQLFRSAGEGVFTDRDQQLLLDMVPKRTDHPEARAAKIEMIDQIVAAKLGIGAQSARPAPQAAAGDGNVIDFGSLP